MSFIKKNTELTNEDVLIGECEGLCAVFEVNESSAMPGLLVVETEHCPLYLDPDESSKVVGPNGLIESEDEA
jgi:hypothetical protein